MNDTQKSGKEAMEAAAQDRLNQMAAKANVGSSATRRMTPSEMKAARQASIANRITWDAPPEDFVDLCARWSKTRESEAEYVTQPYVLRVPRELLENPAGRVTFKGDEYLVVPSRSGGRSEDGVFTPVFVQYKAVMPWETDYDNFDAWDISTSETDDLKGLEVMRCGIYLTNDEFISAKTEILASATENQITKKRNESHSAAWAEFDEEEQDADSD